MQEGRRISWDSFSHSIRKEGRAFSARIDPRKKTTKDQNGPFLSLLSFFPASGIHPKKSPEKDFFLFLGKSDNGNEGLMWIDSVFDGTLTPCVTQY